MARTIFFIILFFLIDTKITCCSEVVLFGKAPSYAGDELIFYTYNDYISLGERELVKFNVDKEGNFECSFNIDHTIRIHLYLGIYKGYLYVTPGRVLEVKLPEKIKKTTQQKLSPYFSETDLSLGVINTDDNELNYLIQLFDNLFSQYFYKPVVDSKLLETKEDSFEKEIERRLRSGTFILNADYYVQNYSLSNSINIDSVIDVIENEFSDIENEYFEVYRKYRFALLKYSSTKYKAKNISSNYFLDHKISYRNPAYMELFNKVYDRYFLFFGRTKKGDKIYEDIGKFKSYRKLNETLSQNEILSNDTLREFVIMKSLHDGFYSNNFSRSALLEVLDTILGTTNIEIHKEIASSIRNKVTKLLKGYYPPDFALYNQDSVLVNLESFRGKYVYLNFCVCMSYTCLKEFAMLSNLKQKHADKFDIVTILADDDFVASLDLIKSNNYNWSFLHYGNQPEVLEKYDIRTFPTYYLIGPDGKLRISPAPSPGENVELQLFKVMRADGVL